jgi:hypothetical protein
MNIIKRLKLEFYLPQRNKAQKKVAGHRMLAKYREEKPREKRSRREQASIEYDYYMANIWQQELEKLEFKISKI